MPPRLPPCLPCKLAHYLWGLLIAIEAHVSPTLAWIMFAGFIVYELDEDWHIRDGAYRDIREMLIGMGIGAVATMMVKTLEAILSIVF